jgi:transcriptional regulator with XRE-family HTH domain
MADPGIGKSRLLEHLTRINMSQAEYARRLKVSRTFASKLISGEKSLSIMKARISAQLFGCRIDDLYTWHDTK